ncbi:helix-turn-helix transcriptional regulator [Yersinia enterocolitica]|uniref:XRE family transcriptional regulator n=1 Tax=Yersinia TaxID=629 RepID=UPI0005E782FC|nr:MULTISPECIES: S24 family peptidase [Yersinia]EKN3779750.1 helix-turn-helix transcriptional regulator [Yersinia enterocolitica]ELI8374837.1 helix-turn-helix transcriptional regulator [Yersinia enterocolitica]UYJ99142.1 helix-turn-helix domain-containing protein [Yersinia enterocolitica]CNH98915.1 repressor protein CI [Yersinia intermedia]HDL6954886.1 helix-turn-helix transcriptional regulator [Yersinia enterocolitica]
MSLDSLSDRLKLAMYEAGVTQSWLAVRVGMTQGAVQKLVSGKASSSRRIVDIAKALGVHPDWLSTGNGPMKNEYRPESLKRLDKEINELLDKRTAIPDDEVEVPLLQDIEFACGDGSIGDKGYDGLKLRFSKSSLRRVGANTDGSGIICFPVHGNSMDPLIPSGATVAINCNDKKIIDGKIYAINQEGWKRLKSLHRTGPNEITIRSYNSAEYPDETLNINELEVIGRMFWVSILF